MNRALLLPVAFSSFALSASAVLIDFSGATDFASNFRIAPTTPNPSGHTMVQSGGLLAVTGNNTGTTALIYVYDTTPGDATAATQSTFSLLPGQSVTISLDVANISATGAGSSIGFYFGSPSAETSGVNFMALMNINSGGSNELFRFSSGATIGGANPNGTLINGTPSSADGGIALLDPVFRKISATYTYLGPNSLSMSLTSGSGVSTITYSGVTALNNLIMGFRVAPTTGTPRTTMQLDNIEVIPEPSTYALFGGLAGLGLALVRRFKRS